MKIRHHHGHVPDLMSQHCARCGAPETVLACFRGVPCKRRIAARYKRRFRLALRTHVTRQAGDSQRWSEIGATLLMLDAAYAEYKRQRASDRSLN